MVFWLILRQQQRRSHNNRWECRGVEVYNNLAFKPGEEKKDEKEPSPPAPEATTSSPRKPPAQKKKKTPTKDRSEENGGVSIHITKSKTMQEQLGRLH